MIDTMPIRPLRADEIELRVHTVKKDDSKQGCSLLLYKNARCDMNILDEVFGIFGWSRMQEEINGHLYCTVSLWDGSQWVSKQDVGVESFADKEKGESSDAFKRACVNIGIGRELYDVPFIWIPLAANEIRESNGKASLVPKVKFEVSEVEHDEKKRIILLKIKDQNGKERFSFGPALKRIEDDPKEEPKDQNLERLRDAATKGLDELAKVFTSLTKKEQVRLKDEKDKCKILAEAIGRQPGDE